MAYTTINKSSLHMNTKLYTGTGSSNSVTGVGFQPDWVWIKDRGSNANHHLFDAVRGVTKDIISNSSNAQGTDAQKLTAFGADGFTVGTNGNVNGSSANMVSWNWKANGQGSANTGGSINSTYTSANVAAGFSIVQWEGTGSAGTIAHGLDVAPTMVIIKNLDAGQSWRVGHFWADFQRYLTLNGTGTQALSSAMFNNTTPTASVFSVGTDGSTNASGETMIAYCFSEKVGYSKINYYQGNGNANGTFIYTGFRPKYVLIKGSVSGSGDAAQNWEVFDNKRDGYNGANDTIAPNNSSAESAEDRVDLVSNGFKIRVNSDGVNDNNSYYIYYAVGQTLVGSNNVPCTAR